MSHAVEFRDVSRLFGPVRAVDAVSFTVAPGEFFSMLGPSGSGKTTCLRLIAGFELPDRGQIFIHGEDVSRVPPYRRTVNTVFQDYALFPHMNVLDNVAYGLRMRNVPRAERHERARAMLDTVKLSGMDRRKPGQLSGGQRQRVALARALVNEPRVLLLDEPLGALDLELREDMQIELKSLQRRLGITFIYVTHDQNEALGMSDRVAVIADGRLQQLDSPEVLYERPRTTFIANFVGNANVFEGALARFLAGDDDVVAVAVRPERVRFGRGGEDDVTLPGRVLDRQYHGATSRYEVAIDHAVWPQKTAGGEAGEAGEAVIVFLVTSSDHARVEPGQEVDIAFARAALHEVDRPA